MCYTSEETGSTLIIPVQTKHLPQFLEALPSEKRQWLENTGFRATSGELCLLPNKTLELEEIYLGIKDEYDEDALAKAALGLRPGSYRLKSQLHFRALLSWGLAQYSFDAYKAAKDKDALLPRRLVLSRADSSRFQKALSAHCLVRDLINRPAEDMGPTELKGEAAQLAERFGASVHFTEGKTLETDFPAIHAVGRAGCKPPCLIELNWGEETHPLVALIGKGVCFDTGGLDLKPSSNMRLMKKDMGGAAHALGLAELIMAHKLPIRLKILIPAVENAISSNAYRPGDIVKTREGLSVEIDNTDAEGRVVLADALSLAKEANPELMIDFATLTGAARVALGTEIGALFTNSDQLAETLLCASNRTRDWLWRLPLFKPYLSQIQPAIADLANSAKTGFGGAITAALFLEQFVGDIPWAHFDIMAWNQSSKPGKPEGGEALGLHATFSYLQERFLPKTKTEC